MKFAVQLMTHTDIPQVLEVDRESYPMPWPASAYRRELNSNHHAHYIVLREQPEDNAESQETEVADDRRSWRSRLPWVKSDCVPPHRRGRIIGYAGMWILADEAHVTTIAVRGDYRRRGFGELLIASLIEMAFEIGARWVTLEVRMSNEAAQWLYRKYGFRNAGLRRRYYSDNNEDALIMTTDDIGLNAYQKQFSELRIQLSHRLDTPPDTVEEAAALAGGRAE